MEKFSGPLQLLLEIIEKKDLEITTISLAQVTEDYLKHLKNNDVPTEELADFLQVAARLIYLKSAAIVPLPQEEESANALAAQLKLYQEFVQATVYIHERLQERQMSFTRPISISQKQRPIEFHPPEQLEVRAIKNAFEFLLKRLQPFFTLQQTAMERVVSVQERIKEIQQVLLSRVSISFRDVTKGAKNRMEVIVSFLALLELMKQQIVHVVQSPPFEDIHLKRID